jgi:hypothetical protein
MKYDKPQKSNISCSCSFVELRPKMMMMMILEHAFDRETEWGAPEGKERMQRGEEDQNMLQIEIDDR